MGAECGRLQHAAGDGSQRAEQFVCFVCVEPLVVLALPHVLVLVVVVGGGGDGRGFVNRESCDDLGWLGGLGWEVWLGLGV